VPGLPQRFNYWSSNELCSVGKGDLFHVQNITQWEDLNTFLVGLGRSHHYLHFITTVLLYSYLYIEQSGYYDTYWTGVAAEGHPGLWVVRSTGFELIPEAVEFKAGSPSNSAANLCLAIEYQADLGRYQWVDYPCSDGYVIVCEYRTCN
jgi:hypothetical protein